MKRKIEIDTEAEYRMSNSFVYTGAQFIEAILAYNREHRTECDSISPIPETPGFLCTLSRDHPYSHDAPGHMKWWDTGEGETGYRWSSKDDQARFLKRRRDQASRGTGEEVAKALEGVSSHDDESS